MRVALRETDDEELRGCLERALAETEGGAPRVTELGRRPFAYETSFAIDELRAGLEDGRTLHLVVKDVGAGLSAAAAAAKPAVELHPGREIAVYRNLLRGTVPAPRFHGAEERGGRAWLFLERVPGEVLTDVGAPAAWQASAAWAGKLGGAVGVPGPGLEPLLLDRDRRWYEHSIAAASAACERGGEDQLAARLRGSAGALLARLEELPQAFVHGELYASNVIVAGEPGGATEVKPVDWELAGRGPFALDLAALVTGWSGEARRAMCEAFGRALPSELAPAPSADDLLAAVAVCELALAVQWLGRPSEWRPPPRHRRDWAAEADRLLEEVGL